jgi:hypothetical protein
VKSAATTIYSGTRPLQTDVSQPTGISFTALPQVTPAMFSVTCYLNTYFRTCGRPIVLTAGHIGASHTAKTGRSADPLRNFSSRPPAVS